MLNDPWIAVSYELIRGPQPTLEDLLYLKDKARLKSVVNLRSESEESRDLAFQAGLTYNYIPVYDGGIPKARHVDYFLKLYGDLKNLPMLVHCLGGVGRTGTFVSIYRIVNGMASGDAISLSHKEVTYMKLTAEQQVFIKDWAANNAYWQPGVTVVV